MVRVNAILPRPSPTTGPLRAKAVPLRAASALIAGAKNAPADRLLEGGGARGLLRGAVAAAMEKGEAGLSRIAVYLD